MYVNILLLLVIILAAGLIAYLLQDRQRVTSIDSHHSLARHSDHGATSGRHYPAVSVHTYGLGCAAASKLKGMRFLGEDAPALPLGDCDLDKCHCRYAHHVDRRSGTLDRRPPPGSSRKSLPALDKEDQRASPGRRAHDLLPV